MSNTNETHGRFWRRMSEIFGRKWYDEYGSECPVSWREMLDRYTPRELKAGLDRLQLRKSEFLPTMPEVSQALDAARSAQRNSGNDPNELRRAYWRSRIIGVVARELGYTVDQFEAVLIQNRNSLGASMLQLLDEVTDSELRTGQRTLGHENMVDKRGREVAAAFNQLRAAQ